MSIQTDEECRWPDLPERYSIALRDAVGFILDRFDVVGIVASGTVLRGEPDPTSDLDIYVVNRESFRQRVQRFSRGVPTEIFVNPVSAIRGYFRKEYEDSRPITAHMLATGFVILSRSRIVDELRAEAEQWLAKPCNPPHWQLVMERYFAATQYEDALDIAGKNPPTALLILNQAVTSMINYWYRSNGYFIPRSKELLSRLACLNESLGRDAQRFFVAPPEDRWRLAKSIADQTVGVHGFFEWESGRQPMPG
ncbi:MAG: hypothetical protein WBJ04_07910 [Bacillota bacterium]